MLTPIVAVPYSSMNATNSSISIDPSPFVSAYNVQKLIYRRQTTCHDGDLPLCMRWNWNGFRSWREPWKKLSHISRCLRDLFLSGERMKLVHLKTSTTSLFSCHLEQRKTLPALFVMKRSPMKKQNLTCMETDPEVPSVLLGPLTFVDPLPGKRMKCTYYRIWGDKIYYC